MENYHVLTLLRGAQWAKVKGEIEALTHLYEGGNPKSNFKDFISLAEEFTGEVDERELWT